MVNRDGRMAIQSSHAVCSIKTYLITVKISACRYTHLMLDQLKYPSAFVSSLNGDLLSIHRGQSGNQFIFQYLTHIASLQPSIQLYVTSRLIQTNQLPLTIDNYYKLLQDPKINSTSEDASFGYLSKELLLANFHDRKLCASVEAFF